MNQKRVVDMLNSLPGELYIEVTNRCNSRCRTCNIWCKEAREELTAEEMARIFQKLGRAPYWITFSGGEPLFQAFKEAGVPAIVTESSVCRIHLKEGTGMQVWHPLALLDGLA